MTYIDLTSQVSHLTWFTNPKFFTRSIGVSTSCKQYLHNLIVTHLGRKTNGGSSIAPSTARIGASSKQYLHNVMVPLLSCNQNGYTSKTRRRILVGANCQQLHHNLMMTIFCKRS